MDNNCIVNLNSISDAVYVIGGKWRLPIIVALRNNPMRFNEIQRTVKDISAKVLSNELKDLELNGLIKRNVYDGSSIKVVYELTSYSESLNDVLKSLLDWGKQHKQKVIELYNK